MSEKIMKIAQFITQYPYPNQFEKEGSYYCAGAARVAQQISEGLVRKGHEVHVYTAASDRKYGETEQNGVIAHRSPSITSINTTEIPPTILFDHLRYEGFDLLHAHNSTPPGTLAAYVKSNLENIPLVITHHGGEHYEPHGGLLRRGGLYLYTRVLIDRLFSHASTVVVPSSGYVGESRVLSNSNVNVSEIRNGVEVQKFDIDLSPKETKQKLGFDPETFLILYMGAHHPRKGPDVLVESFEKFRTEVAETKLIMAGSGTLTDSLRHASIELGIDEQVDFSGYIPEEEKPKYLKAADVFVLPSVVSGAEMFPIAILEAAAAGTPVITSAFPTLKPIINEYEIGELAEPGDVASLTHTLLSVYDSDRREEYSSNAYQMAIDHSWDEVVDEYIRLFLQIKE